MRTRTMSAIVAVAGVGCAGSTDVIQTGPDTYMVATHSTTGSTSGAEQRAKAFAEARDYCEKSGKQLETIRAVESGPAINTSSAEVHFRCVTAAAPK